MKGIVDYVVNLIYPKRCPVCGRVLKTTTNLNGNIMHEECIEVLEKSLIKEPRCKKCGAELSSLENKLGGFCVRCLRDKPGMANFYYEKGFGLFRYTEEIKQSIKKIKYNSRKEYVDFYGLLLAKKFYKEIADLKVDYLIPVPMYKQKEKIRGYNQATELAKSFSDHLNKNFGVKVEVRCDFVFRGKKTTKLSTKDDEERWMEISGAFYGKDANRELRGKIVCIVDDIYTTGATIIHLSEILKKLGASKVYFATIAIVSNRV